MQNHGLFLYALTLPKKTAVVGRGILRHNALLAQTLQTQVIHYWQGHWQNHEQNNKQDHPTDLKPWMDLALSFVPSHLLPTTDFAGLLGWGQKPSFWQAKQWAERLNLPVFAVEDGFLRSLGSGQSHRHAVSLVVDDEGMYFDTRQASRFETLMAIRWQDWTIKHEEYAHFLIQKILDNHLSKFNQTLYCPDLIVQDQSVDPSDPPEQILVVDQVAKDLSIAGAGADQSDFYRMLSTACQNHPQAQIWLKTHPAGKGYLAEIVKADPRRFGRVRILSESVNVIALLQQVSQVYTVSSHMGFEALLLGKRVHCFGVSWYAGWGLTDDAGAPKALLMQVQNRRLARIAALNAQTDFANLYRSAVNIEAVWQQFLARFSAKSILLRLFFVMYLDYSRYVDPASGQACSIEQAMDWLIANRQLQQKLSEQNRYQALTVFEFSRWKVPFVKQFCASSQLSLQILAKPRWQHFLSSKRDIWSEKLPRSVVKTLSQTVSSAQSGLAHLPFLPKLDRNNPILVWGLAKRQRVQADYVAKDGFIKHRPPIFCMEDGFIRSNGLGATLLAPLSVVLDRSGIYYDATRPSDLENLLKNCPPLSEVQNQRVQDLLQILLAHKVSKYNVGKALHTAEHEAWQTKIDNARSAGRKIVLIVGQVEDDLSVKYCGSAVVTNADLILRVKQARPADFLIFKPHPDVEAGLRVGKVDPAILMQVDQVAVDIAMPVCLDWVDEVHTISSLTGFEALLRQKTVCCYGLPFYAGWGLTVEMDADQPSKQAHLQRRQREQPLTLSQLIFCTLIDYPIYRLPKGFGVAQVEQVVAYLYQTDRVQADQNSPNDFQPLNPQKLGKPLMQWRHHWQQKQAKKDREE